jgi:Glycosyl transferases group 1
MTVLADGWYAEALGLHTLEREGLPPWLPITNPVFRGFMLWWRAHRYQSLVLVGTGVTFKVVMLLEWLRPRPRPYLVLLQFIPIPEGAWGTLGRRSRAGYCLRLLFQRRVVAPALRRSLICAHALSSWEVRGNAEMFDVDERRFKFVPFTRVLTRDEIPPYRDRGRRVLASGRSLCDWPTVFAAATGQGWDLEIVCSSEDLPLVKRLNVDGVAKVRHDIPLQRHREMLKRFAVYFLALEEAEVSCGQIRVMDAVGGGTPVVASRVRGLSDYLVDQETALLFEPGDALGARDAVNALLSDTPRAERLRSAAFEDAREWTEADYIGAIGRLIQGPGSPGPSAASPRRCTSSPRGLRA